jgi:hypothetical protein
MQPLTELSDELMYPKARYQALFDVIGAPWLSFTGTAADQAHVRPSVRMSGRAPATPYPPRHACVSLWLAAARV